jgi:FixJ family two-component response regulator
MTNEESIVFIVDDDDGIRQALEKLVRSVGLAVKTFASAEEFLKDPWPDKPSCLVLDVRLHGMSGLELQSELNSAIPIPIIFISGYGNVSMSVRVMKAGAVDFIEKPFDDQVLLDSIYKAIERDAQRRRERTETDKIQQHIDSLTLREREVYLHIASGKPNKQIAYALGVSEQTIKVHRARIMEKMDAQSIADLVRFANITGLYPPKG